MKKIIIIFALFIIAISSKAQITAQSDLMISIQQLVNTKYVLRPGSGIGVCRPCAPLLFINGEPIEYSELNNFTLSQIYSIYYLVAAESKLAKQYSLVNGRNGHYGYIIIYTNTFTGIKDYTIGVGIPIKKWSW